MKIAILGTGIIGSELTEGLIKAGHETIVYNRTASKTEPLVLLGAKAVATAAEAIAEADASIIVFTDGAAIEKLLQDEATKAALNGKKILNASTTDPTQIEEYAKVIVEQGGNLAEISILVGGEQLSNKQGIFLLGCDADVVEFWNAVLSGIGEVHTVGGIGNASKAEAPLLFGSMFINVILAYSAAVAHKLNIPHEIVSQQVAMFTNAGEYLLPGMFARDYTQVMASTDNFKIVSETAISTAKSLGMPTKSLEGALELFEEAVKHGYGAQDGSSIVEVLLNSNK